MPARFCPHCDIKSNFTHRTDYSGNFGDPEVNKKCSFSIHQCQNCNGLVLLHYDVDAKTKKEVFSYPTYIPHIEDSIFNKAAEDFLEGVRCFQINANKASSTMFRRSLQQIMIDKNAKGNRLVDQINDLQSRSIITSDLADWAHEIRFLGNEGAHPNTDGLDNISPDQINEIIDFINALFQYIYVMPNKVTEAKSRRSNSPKT